MFPFTIIKYFNVIEDQPFRKFTGDQLDAIETFGFQRMNKTLGNGVIVTVAHTAHTRFPAMELQYRLKQMGAILTSMVRMKTKTFRRITVFHRFYQCPDNKIFCLVIIQIPSKSHFFRCCFGMDIHDDGICLKR